MFDAGLRDSCRGEIRTLSLLLFAVVYSCQPYNALLSINQLVDNGDLIAFFDNEAL